MTRSRLVIAVLAATVAFTPLALANKDNAPKAKKTPPDAPKGWIVLEEDFWLPLAHEPGAYFHRAHEEFLREDYNLAAVDLRQAAAFLKLQGRRSTYNEHCTMLYAAANRLTNLASRVENKAVKKASQLDREFARAHYALAKHDYAMAKESWNKKEPYTTGRNINAALFNLESGYSWANAELDAPEFDAVADANALADKLIAGQPKDFELTTTLNAVESTIESLSTRINELPKDPGLAMDESVATIAPAIDPGWVLVEEDIWTDLPDSAGRHLHNVYEAYLQRRPERAATEIHRAIFDLELQAGRAKGEDRTALMNSIHNLEGLLVPSDHTRARLGVPRQQYGRVIAGACYALAEHHCQMAQADWADHLKTITGYDMKWATNYIDRGRVWADQLNNPTTDEHLRDARQLSETLIANKGDEPQNVGSCIAALEQDAMALRAMAR